eukprot:471135-Rhodomonas_salina.1
MLGVKKHQQGHQGPSVGRDFADDSESQDGEEHVIPCTAEGGVAEALPSLHWVWCAWGRRTRHLASCPKQPALCPMH